MPRTSHHGYTKSLSSKHFLYDVTVNSAIIESEPEWEERERASEGWRSGGRGGGFLSLEFCIFSK